MSKLPNIIQRRELGPLFQKAHKIARHYEKAVNCPVSVMTHDCDTDTEQFEVLCKFNCPGSVLPSNKETCLSVHMEAINNARTLGGSYIYTCPAGKIFWTSPFFSGERFAGAFVSGGIRTTKVDSSKVKSLARMMLFCADQISELSYFNKNIPVQVTDTILESDQDTAIIEVDNNSMEMERVLLANLRRGDITEARIILAKLLNAHYQEAKHNFPAFRLKALELAILLSRSASESSDFSDVAALETSNLYLAKIEESSNLKEITEILYTIIEKMSGEIFAFHGVRHYSALRKAERFIWENYTRKVNLREIADVSGLSAPYFSTIFKEEMGENLSNYLNRLRTEKAATMLVTTNLSISEIAKTCGFEDQSWFSKIFKNNTGLTPGKYRDQGSNSGISA